MHTVLYTYVNAHCSSTNTHSSNPPFLQPSPPSTLPSLNPHLPQPSLPPTLLSLNPPLPQPSPPPTLPSLNPPFLQPSLPPTLLSLNPPFLQPFSPSTLPSLNPSLPQPSPPSTLPSPKLFPSLSHHLMAQWMSSQGDFRGALSHEKAANGIFEAQVTVLCVNQPCPCMFLLVIS